MGGEGSLRAYRVTPCAFVHKPSAEDAGCRHRRHQHTWENALVDTSGANQDPHGYNVSLRKAVALVRNRTFNKLENMLDAV